MRFLYLSAYTLVELLIAMILSLILLYGILELFRYVSGTMNEARTSLNMSANLNGAALLLRQDLARIPATLPAKPGNIDRANGKEISDRDGYLEITEGPDTAESHPFRVGDGTNNLPDKTVGDTDDIIGFVAKANANSPFRGLLGGEIAERYAAEVVWFVRGNTLYRRVLLIDDQRTSNSTANTIEETADRKNRFGHGGRQTNSFPYPLYSSSSATDPWYYLRMPLLEETLHLKAVLPWKDAFPPPSSPEQANPDLWTQPYFFPNLQDRKSGALTQYVPRHPRAGEDVVLTNVLSFDIRVWDSGQNDFVDLGTGSWTNNQQASLGNVWDSWTQQYAEQPPFTKNLEAIKFTIRCFDPASKIIKQVTVIHRFPQ